MKQHEIFIRKRFCGPPDSGNGGYVCGLMAQEITGTAEVRLHKPPPLERPLGIEHSPDGRALLYDGEVIIAQARPSSLEIEVPKAPSLEEALHAAKGFVKAEEHFFPTCFVCGPARKHKDGLCIFPGWLEDARGVASPWSPDETLVDGSGRAKTEFVWASLDCPGAFAVLGKSIRPVVLGSLTAEIVTKPVLGQQCIAMGWQISADGRKHFAGTALFSEQGEVLAKAKAVWIEI